MTGGLEIDVDNRSLRAAAGDRADTVHASAYGLDHRATDAEDFDSTIVADTTLTHDLSQHGLDITHHKSESIASSPHSLTATYTLPEPFNHHTINTGPRGVREPSSPSKEAPTDPELDGANLTLDVTFVAEPHDLEGDWRKDGQEYDKSNAEADDDVPNGSDLPSSSSPVRSHSRPNIDLQLNVKPPSPQPWDLAIPGTDFDPTKTTGLSIPLSPAGSQNFSNMQITGG